MSNSNSRIDRLKVMLGLEEKRASLQHELDSLQEQLSSLKDQLFSDTSSPSPKSGTNGSSSPVKVRSSKGGRSKRGALKEQILTALSSAGEAGVRVTELAAALGTKAANIHAWFHSTGKKIKGLSKITGGHYRLKGGAGETQSPSSSSASAPKASAGRRKGKAKGARRGELSENIIKALGAAGDKGLKIKDLAEKVGANYRNVSVWFVTTGKNFPKVKKVAPAHYKLAA